MKLEAPLVSVYIPTKNRADLLQRALDSVLAQTYRPIEVIVVDDGSSDGTPALLAQRCSQHPELAWIRNEASKGAPAARNAAVLAARGEFITGLDDDDEFTPDRIESFVRDWQKREQRGDVFCALYSQEKSRKGPHQAITHKPAQVDWHQLCTMNLISNQVFTRRSTLLAVGMFDPDLPMWQDLECWIRLTKAFGPARLTDTPTYIFYQDAAPDRISFGGKGRLRQAYDHLVSKHAGILERPHRRALYLQMYADHYPVGVDWQDVRAFVREFGLHLPGTMRLVKLALRQRLTRLVRQLRGAS